MRTLSRKCCMKMEYVSIAPPPLLSFIHAEDLLLFAHAERHTAFTAVTFAATG